MKRRLIWHGVLLFLLAMLAGLAIPAMKNPRMGLSAHLGALTGGIFLMALGAIWDEVKLGPRAAAAAFWLALYGNYANLASNLFAAAVGTSRLTPLAGAGHQGLAWQEAVVGFGLISLALAIIAASGLVLFGLRGASPDAPRVGGT